MHQPLIPAGSEDLRTAAIISSLQYMMEHLISAITTLLSLFTGAISGWGKSSRS